MDTDTLDKLRAFDVELGRWKHMLTNHVREHSNLPEFIIVRMCIEELVEFVLKDGQDLTESV